MIWGVKEFTKQSELPRCLPFRRRLHYPTELVELLRDGIMLGYGDDFRRLRILHYFFKAVRLEPHQLKDGVTKRLHGVLPSSANDEPALEGNEADHRDVRAINTFISETWRKFSDASPDTKMGRFFTRIKKDYEKLYQEAKVTESGVSFS